MLRSLQFADERVEVHNFNNDFLLLRSTAAEVLTRLGRAIYERRFSFVDEVIVAETEICLKLNDNFNAASIASLQALKPEEQRPPDQFLLPVCFSDHPDWKLVTAATGLSRKKIIQGLLETDLSLAMFGFLPGFAYLKGLDEALQVARKTVPAKYIPANSLALGGQYVGVYSLPSPGGWYVLGQLPFSLLRIPDIPPVAIHPGDRIRLVSITATTFRQLQADGCTLLAYNDR